MNTKTDLEFTKLAVSPRFAKKIGSTEIEVSGNLFDCGVQKNGYHIVIGAIYVPSARRTIFCAAACAPDDQFDMDEATNICGMRGISQVLYALSGITKKGDSMTLLGPADATSYLHGYTEIITADYLYEAAMRRAPNVAERAEERALFKEFQQLLKSHKTLRTEDITTIYYEALKTRKRNSASKATTS